MKKKVVLLVAVFAVLPATFGNVFAVELSRPQTNKGHALQCEKREAKDTVEKNEKDSTNTGKKVRSV